MAPACPSRGTRLSLAWSALVGSGRSAIATSNAPSRPLRTMSTRSFENEIDSRQLGELVMDHLRDLDEVAFVRFASVYRQFADAGDFVDELAPVSLKTKQSPR